MMLGDLLLKVQTVSLTVEMGRRQVPSHSDIPAPLTQALNIAEGHRVQIIGGPMAGTEEIILNVENKGKL
jgi:hypothetical protein